MGERTVLRIQANDGFLQSDDDGGVHERNVPRIQANDGFLQSDDDGGVHERNVPRIQANDGFLQSDDGDGGDRTVLQCIDAAQDLESPGGGRDRVPLVAAAHSRNGWAARRAGVASRRRAKASG